MSGWLFKFTMAGVRLATWVLRRVDYYVEKSVINLHPADQDPHLVANALRERGAVLRSHSNRGWIVGGYDEVTELLKDDRISSAFGNNSFARRVFQSASGEPHVPFLEHPSIQQMDPPDHSRLRKLVAIGFLHKYIQSLAPMIETQVDELLSPVDMAQPFDLIDVLARPLPAIVIAEMMGVPTEDRVRFEAWSERLLGLVQLDVPEKIGQGVRADIEMREYMSDLVARKRQCSGQDLISQLISAEEDGDKLSLDELLSTCVLLLVAGHETTTRLIGSTVLLLLQNPSQLHRILSQGDSFDGAIEETLRLEPPVLFAPRVVGSSFEYRGHRFRNGQLLLLSLSAANRDPAVVADPHAFDINRPNRRHISFGHGIHLCLGMTLARLETQIALAALFEKWPDLMLVDEKPAWGQSPMFRGLESLSLRQRSDPRVTRNLSDSSRDSSSIR